ncbi:MBL fold metallo-hydrolase [Chloroflexota bacterium]
MRIQILGAHNCESRDTKLAGLLIDDVLAIDGGSLTSSLSFTAQQQLKAILLTHQHYDHLRDIPAIAMNAYLHNSTINIYTIPPVHDVLETHLLNNEVYPNFLRRPEGKPTSQARLCRSMVTAFWQFR